MIAAPLHTTSSLASSTTTSSTLASPRQLALDLHALSATQRPASTVPRTARQTASSAGASQAACPAPSLHRTPLRLALASLPASLTHARSWRLPPLAHAALMSRLPSLILRLSAPRPTTAAPLHTTSSLASSTTTSSTLASLRQLALDLRAPSATQ